jgi:hypothetical protein
VILAASGNGGSLAAREEGRAWVEERLAGEPWGTGVSLFFTPPGVHAACSDLVTSVRPGVGVEVVRTC